MHGWPDAPLLEEFIGRVRQRLLTLRAMEGAALGAVVSALFIAAGAGFVVAVPLVLLAALSRVAFGDRWQFGWWRAPSQLAVRVERRAPACRNLLVTATELMAEPSRTSPYVGQVVVRRAVALVRTMDPGAIFSSRDALAGLGLSAVLLAASLARPIDVARPIGDSRVAGGLPGIRRVDVTVIPPAYSRMPRATLVDPARIEALATSRIQLRIEAAASSIGIETLSGTRTLARSDGAFTIDLVVDADGFIAIEPMDSTGSPGARRLIGLAVAPDRPPRIKLASPGRDLFFATVPDSLPVVIEADDDLGVASLRLQYTAVSGSGERFTFTERDVTVRVNADNPRSWRARGIWRLDQLHLAPGDLVVYRAVATDHRPGAPQVVSESYVIEVVTPGAIAAEGFAADDQRDRYAVSQQMVILKTERLIAGRSGMTADSVGETARLLAAEQRQVRAEFVFMMGGELEDAALETAGTLELDETAEAEAEGDILAGRLQNQGRIDMMRAIRAMSRASALLTDGNLDEALRTERVALENLTRAFARSRFILRALTQRERIDLSRRLSGTLMTASGISGPVTEPEVEARTAALRRLLAALAARQADSSARAARRAGDAAIALLRADPASDTLRRLAARVQELASISWVSTAVRLDSLVSELTALIASGLPSASRSARPLDAGALEGAWRDAMLRSRARR